MVGFLTPRGPRAARSLARTRAASASRSDAANFAAMVAMVRGLCWGAGSALRGRGRREALLRRGDRLGDPRGPESLPESVELRSGLWWREVGLGDMGWTLGAGSNGDLTRSISSRDDVDEARSRPTSLPIVALATAFPASTARSQVFSSTIVVKSPGR